MKTTAAKPSSKIFIKKSYGDTKRRCILQSQGKPQVNVQLHWILVYFKSLVGKVTVSRLSYDLGVHGVKNWDIIDKNRHSTFHIGKPWNFNSLREVT